MLGAAGISSECFDLELSSECFVQLTKLCNIVTTIRIYTALHTIQNFPLVDKITGVAGAAVRSLPADPAADPVADPSDD